MGILERAASWNSKRGRRRRNRPAALRLEQLEPRALLSGNYVTTFRTDSGPDLDLYQPCSGGDNQILFDIEVKDLDVSTIKSARLTLSVWDVDYTGSGSNGQPERDPVYLNGHGLSRPTSYLTGANEQWSTCTFEVDPKWIQDGSNSVRIDIDVLDGGWCVECDWGQLEIEAQEIRVDQLSAFGDTNLSQNGGALGDIVWDIGGTSHPIADAGGASFFGLIPGKFTLEARVGVDSGSFPDETFTVKYEWGVAGTGKSGEGQFTVDDSHQESEITVYMPTAVGKYDLEITFDIYDKDGNEINEQTISQTLYATLSSSRFSTPDVDWVDRATSWASGATTAQQALLSLNSSVYSQGWSYQDVPTSWQSLVEGTATQGNCVSFSNTWAALAQVLGVSASTQQTRGSGLGFITKTGAVSPDGITGNAHQSGAATDRWKFSMHQMGYYQGQYYDPTFNKTWTGSKNDFIEWNITRRVTDSHGYLRYYEAGGYRFYPTLANPHGWGDYLYEKAPSSAPLATMAASPGAQTSGAATVGLALADTWTARGVDSNGDGLFDALALDLQLDVAAAGDYILSGYLEKAGQFITDRSSAVSSAPFCVAVHADQAGTVSATVLFCGEDIFQSGLDGPYTAYLTIGDGTSLIDSGDFEISGFTCAQFGETPLQISGAADSGYDQDADGKYDDLVVSVTLDARAAASGWLGGALYSSTGEFIADASASVNVAVPGGTVDLVFDGTQILRSGFDGPYVFQATLLDDTLVQIASYSSNTQAYSHLDFEARGQLGAYADHGEDTNGNGAYDLLVVDAQVEVTTAGSYSIEASLYDGNGTKIEDSVQTASLSGGTNTFQIEFNGSVIYENGVNGPYYVRYVALRESLYLDYVEDAFATSAYSYTQFEAPAVAPVELTGVYSDAATDTDGNGLYNHLDVNVEVLVQNSGSYDINARLMDSSGNEIGWASGSAHLVAGEPQSVQLRYDGAQIGENGVDGPFTLQDVYVYNVADVSQAASAYRPYATSAYLASQFEGYVSPNEPPVIEPISDMTVNEGELISFPVMATDAAGQVLSYRLCTCSPAGATIDPVTGQFSWTPDDDTDGAAVEVKVIVADDGSPALECIRSFFVTVNNVAPSAAIDAPLQGVRGQSLTFTFNANDLAPVDQAAGFTYQIDWDGNGAVDQTVAGLSGIQSSHVFSREGRYFVRVTAVDKNGGESSEAIHPIVVKTVAYQQDPSDPAKTALVIGGTTKSDLIVISGVSSGRNGGKLGLVVNGTVQMMSSPTGRIIVYGQAGNDMILVSSSARLSTLVYGDDGNDYLKGGGGASVLVGGGGNDILVGGTSRNLLMGGLGSDLLVGGAQDDLLIAGLTAFDSHCDAALLAILNEWTSSRSYVNRFNNISGTGSGSRLNGDFFLVASNPDETRVSVFDDDSSDGLGGLLGRDWFFGRNSSSGSRGWDHFMDRLPQETVTVTKKTI